MAKSARASSTKVKRGKLREHVFQPVEDQRLKRLSAKLLELASQPKAEIPEAMDVDSEAKKKQSNAHNSAVGEDDADVEMDGNNATSNLSARKTQSKNTGRVHKKRRNKPASQITFPTFRNGKKVGPKKKGKR